MSPTPQGVLRVMRDVMVHRAGGGEMVVISREPGVIDERLRLEVADQRSAVAFRVQVAESRPMVTDGAVRHRLRLRVVSDAPVEEAGVEGPNVSHGGAQDDE